MIVNIDNNKQGNEEACRGIPKAIDGFELQLLC